MSDKGSQSRTGVNVNIWCCVLTVTLIFHFGNCCSISPGSATYDTDIEDSQTKIAVDNVSFVAGDRNIDEAGVISNRNVDAVGDNSYTASNTELS